MGMPSIDATRRIRRVLNFNTRPSVFRKVLNSPPLVLKLPEFAHLNWPTSLI